MDQAVQTSKSVGDPLPLARAQMLAAACRLVFDKWRQHDAELCASAHQTLCRLDDPSADPYQQMTYAHILTLQGRYREALQIFDAGVSRTDHAVSLIPHFGALSGKTMALLRMGHLGDVLRITRAARESMDENRARAWLLSFREAWVRILAFDFEGAFHICEAISEESGRHHSFQPEAICQIAAGYIALDRQDYGEAIEHFKQVYEPKVSTKFFLHWAWRLTAQLESGNACLLSGNIAKARTVADDSLQSALSTADPYLQALAWDLKARVAIAESDLSSAGGHIEETLAIVDRFEILVPAWQAHATAWQLFRIVKEYKKAETHRDCAKACIIRIADSFASDEPLRATFLAAAPVRRILRAGVANKETRQHDVMLSAAS